MANMNSFVQDFEKEHDFEKLLSSINKNLIIHNTNFSHCNGDEGNVEQFFFKLDLLFKQLARNGYALEENEKVELVINKGSDFILKRYMSAEINTYEEVKGLFSQNITKPVDDVFNENEWVRVFESDNFPFENEKSETGYVFKAGRDGFYEIICKGKVLKIHGSKLMKL